MRSLARTNKKFYVVGGTLNPDAPSYVERKADQELYERVLAGDFCYVLTPRQMGKSSLMARTAGRLQQQGIYAALVDLTAIGSEKGEDSAGKWYYGVAHQIIRGVKIQESLKDWWRARENLPALQRLTEFFSDVVLAKTSDQVIIFVDEIDTTINLPFTDDFFAAIRACYNARATEPEFKRLSFVLLGSASPSDLIKDIGRTPFNIGRCIDLTDFTFEEARPLASGLKANDEQREQSLKRILYWTGGHPYLTQKLCQDVTQDQSKSCDEAGIDRTVEEQFLTPEANREEHIKFVGNLLVGNKKLSRRLLKLYRRIYRGRMVIDSPLSPVHSALKLSGVVKPSKDRKLQVRNRIYEQVFTDEWAQKALPADWNRHIVIAFIIFLLGFGIWYTAFLPLPYINVLRTASEDYLVAYDAYVKLRGIPGYVSKADELMAEFWDRRARLAEAQGNRDEALLSWLKALSVQATDSRRSEVSLLAIEDYENLLITFRHNDVVNAIAFSRDGKIVTGSDDRTAQLWNAKTGQPIGHPLTHGGPVLAVAFSPDGNTVLTGSSDGMARLWSADTGKPIGQPLKHGDWVRAVAFSPDGRTVLTGSDDGTARLWNAETGKPIGHALTHKGSVRAVAFSPDGRTVLTGSRDEAARLWNAKTGKPIGQPLKHGDWVRAVAFSPDGRTVLTGSDDRTAQLWNAKTGKPMGHPLTHGGLVRAVAFSPDGRTVLTGSSDGTARLWSAETGHPIAKPFRLGNIVRAVAFSPDGRTVLTGSSDGTARLWSVETDQSVADSLRSRGPVLAVAFSPDGNTVLTGSSDGMARLWSADTGKPIGQPLKHGDWVVAAAFSLDGKTAITGSRNGTARLWNADTGKPIGQPFKHGYRVLAADFSPDGKTAITGSDDGTARLWSADTGESINLTFTHGGVVLAVAFSPDGNTVLTGGNDGTARLWNAKTGEPIGQPFKHEDWVRAVAFSPDGKTVLTGSDDGAVRLWSVETGKLIGQPFTHGVSVQAVAFSPDGRAAVSMTLLWVHQFSIDNPAPRAGRLLNGSQTGAYHFLDGSGNQLHVVSYVTGDSIRIDTVRFDSLDASPMPGDPNSLLEKWRGKLMLKFDEQGKIVPVWPVESIREPNRERPK